MSSKESEYEEMFLAEALDNYEELNQLFTDLEKDTSNKRAIDAIFRITHTLKGNAMGMGFEEIADLGHVMEDVFSEVKQGNLVLDSSLFDSLFKANDKLGELIQALKTKEPVKYKGIRTKLKVVLNKVKEQNEAEEAVVAPLTEEKPDAKKNEVLATEAPEEERAVQEKDNDITVLHNNEESTDPEGESDDNQPKIAFSDLVQIPVRKLDALMNLVGELIIERDSLVANAIMNGQNTNKFTRLQRITSDLQYGVMDVRLVQVGFMFKKFSRVIRDVAAIENKKVNLELKGTEIEIDRNVLKIMSDSLVHLVRNAVSHGIELSSERVKNGKPESGKITLNARNEKDTVIIEVTDDGAGIDPSIIKKKVIEKGLATPQYMDSLTEQDIIMFIFEPGFSKNDQITEVSGRGVGMDVVKRATESIGGKIEVQSKVGEGSTVSLFLPSSMAVKGALLFDLEDQQYAVPLTYTEAVVSLRKNEIHKVGSALMSKYLDKTISVVFLKDLMYLSGLEEVRKAGVLHETFNTIEMDKKLHVLVVSHGNKRLGIVVDKLLQQKEIVEKTLSSPLHNIDLISGATILGNGNVCLVLDVAQIINVLFKEKISQKI